ncbi:hypothetical protein FACS1894211_15860 [Clostridia bacterium]|nr:hypothetical protein FACS1894211_15860 [Clostridia bacterium]
MDDKERLGKLLADIEDEKNCYAAFPYTYESCIVARELLQRLHNDEAIEDTEFVAASERIGAAKRRLIEMNRAYVAQTIERSKSKLTRENIVYSVYDVTFGHAL